MPATLPRLAAQMGSGNIQTGALLTAQGQAHGIFTLPLGQNNITAQYSGDANYVGSTSSATTVNVQADFTFEAATRLMTISSPGASGSYEAHHHRPTRLQQHH